MTDTGRARSRRAVLAAAGAAGLGVVAAVSKPAIVRAGVDGDVVLGDDNTTTTTTTVSVTEATTAFHATAEGAGTGVEGWSETGAGVVGFAGPAAEPPPAHGNTGVYGYAAIDLDSAGVYGESPDGFGVWGVSATGYGVAGNSDSSKGVSGVSTSGPGVYARSETGYGLEASSGAGVAISATGAVRGLYANANTEHGVYATTNSTTYGAVVGRSTEGVGVIGTASGALDLRTGSHTGVLGYADAGTSARGVHGKSTTGRGVFGEATTGVGGYFSATSGTALQVAGKAKLNRSGRVNVAANRSYVDVTVAGGLTSASKVFAMLQTHRTGVWVTGVRLNYPSTGKARIYLNKVASTTSTTPLAWFVLD